MLIIYPAPTFWDFTDPQISTWRVHPQAASLPNTSGHRSWCRPLTSHHNRT